MHCPGGALCLCSLSIRFLRIDVNRQAVSKWYWSREYRPFCRGPWSRHDNSETKPSISVLCRNLGPYIFVIGGLLFYEACLRITKCRHQRRKRGVSRQDVGGFPHVWQNQMKEFRNIFGYLDALNVVFLIIYSCTVRMKFGIINLPFILSMFIIR